MLYYGTRHPTLTPFVVNIYLDGVEQSVTSPPRSIVSLVNQVSFRIETWGYISQGVNGTIISYT